MDPLSALPEPIIDALARRWIVLTGNQRAARTVRHAFDSRQRALGLTYWEPPSVFAWDSWLVMLWRRMLLEGHTGQLLLNSTQEHALWRSIIAADPGAASLRPLDSLAELAVDAWHRLHAYGRQHRLRGAAVTSDTRAFVRWASEFQRRCARAECITADQLPAELAAYIFAGKINLPEGILLAGFDIKTPAQTALLKAASEAGAETEELDLNTSSNQRLQARHLTEAENPHAELLACARWLRARLAEDPMAHLAVIVPDIDSERAVIDRAFRGILAPELEAIDATTGSGPFEFSLGVPLDRTPIVATALDILRWCAGPLSLDRVTAQLLSPYFAADRQSANSEFIARAEFDAFVLRDRPLLEPQIGLDDFASLLSQSKSVPQMPALRAHLRTLIAVVRRSVLTRDRSHADWVTVIQDLLSAAGGVPAADLDSAEFQATEKWESALHELATLDFDPQAVRISFRTALDTLGRIAGKMLFAPESRGAPIQIMGPLESAGSNFDAVWFLRAGDLTWPPVPSPNPLLTYSLQHDFAMPGADMAQDASRALRTTRRIAISAPAVVFSYAQQTTSGHQRKSPLLAELNLETANTPLGEPEPIPIRLNLFLDDTPIPVPPSTALRGGASILEAQAACAFRAFAERRLFSTALDSISLGLDARDRGNIVHNVLHEFWTQVQSQAVLRRMTTADRDALLAQCIDSALARDHSNLRAGWSSAYINAERERLLRLLRPWLDFEADVRPPFIVKSSEEQLKAVAIGPLHLDIRVDRVDETVPGDGPGQPPAEIILDYKTGGATPAKWEGDRPDLPQLPLYAVVSSAPQLAAVAFASIRPGKFMGLSGYQAQNGVLPNAKRGQTLDLEQKREEWRATLTVLAEEFSEGRAIASPKDYPNTCRYCRQRLLCRLNPSTLTTADHREIEDANGSSSRSPSGPEAQP